MPLSDSPQDIDKNNWYYEDPDGIDLVHEVLNKQGLHVSTEHIKIPWKMLKKSLERFESVMVEFKKSKRKNPKARLTSTKFFTTGTK